MSNPYILIHDAWHAKWCWDKIVFLLRQDGHHIIAPDLPGHGADQTHFKFIPRGVAQIKKIYVKCLFDNALSLAAQDYMAEREGCSTVSLPADRSPYFSTPVGLFELLI